MRMLLALLVIVGLPILATGSESDNLIIEGGPVTFHTVIGFSDSKDNSGGGGLPTLYIVYGVLIVALILIILWRKFYKTTQSTTMSEELKDATQDVAKKTHKGNEDVLLKFV